MDRLRTAILYWLGAVIGIVFIYASVFQAFDSYFHRIFFVGYMLVAVFISKPTFKNSNNALCVLVDVLFIILSLAVTFYGCYHHQDITIRFGSSNQYDYIFSIIFLFLILEATRRSAGMPIFIIAIIALIYTWFGPYFPYAVAHGGFNFREIVELNFMTMEGVYGIMIGVVADFIILFTIFGAILHSIGGVDRFTALSQSLLGWQTGGAAKTATIASGIMGSLSGSSAANVVTTGSFTIPMMKKTGFTPTIAGAVEAAASTGGQIMPPIMGASAFVIMAVLGISYWDVCKAAALPAIFYFISIGICVHYTAKKLNIKGLPKSELPPFKDSFLRGGLLLTPIIAIIYFLVQGYTAVYAGFSAIITLVVVSFLRKETRLTLTKFINSVSKGSQNVVGIASVCAGAGIIVSCFIISGLGMRISSLIVTISGTSENLALALTALACIVLGMGMPTVGAYILVATLGAPALINLGYPAIAVHIFVFFYAILGNVTPPVALAAYAAAPIAGDTTSPWKIGWQAFFYALPAFILPFIFIRNTGLLFLGTFFGILYSIINAFIAIYAVNLAVVGFLRKPISWIKRIILLGSALLLFKIDPVTDIIGYSIMAFVIFLEWKGGDKK